MAEEETQDQMSEAPEADDTDHTDSERENTKVAKANREAHNLRKRLKELEPLAQRAKELEDAQKTDAQRASEAQRAAEEARDKAGLEVMKLRVAVRKGLSESQAKRLIGVTEEEIEADAEELVASFKDVQEPTGPPSGRPKERLRGGSDPTAPPEETDPKKLAALIRRGF